MAKAHILVLFWQVNQKMILTLTASIMYWSLQQPEEQTGQSAETDTPQNETSTLQEPSVDDEDGSITGSRQVENRDKPVEK